ncbi:MAG: right-handed parallel beta-helix repeat-containing protein [Clostridia bacterium]|nr:right-handed parallel beta-helix repeat-containing protein [Clostridia bacterium]
MAITIKINKENSGYAQTLAEAREQILVAAKDASADSVSEIEVELSQGSYILSEPFVLSEKENPELKKVKITLKAGADARPLVAAWHHVKGPFEAVEGKPYYRCRLEKDENGNYPRFHDLYYKGKRLKIAGSPMWVNMEDLTKEERGPGDIDHTGIYMPVDFFAPIERRGLYCPIEIARQVAESDSECTEMRMFVQWEQFTLRVTGVDLSDTKEIGGKTYALIILDENFVPYFVHGMHRANNMFGRATYFHNDVAFLTEENSFVYDWKNGYLYFIVDDPAGPEEGMLMRPALDALFVLEEVSDVTVEGLDFTGVSSSFVCDNGYYAQLFNLERRQNNRMGDRLRHGAIVGISTRKLTVKNCAFRGIGCNGVLLCDRTLGASICDNRFFDVAMSAISVGNPFGTWCDPQKNRNGRISIVNNYLEHIAYEYSSATAIYLGLCDIATISHNTIKGCGYTGISAGCDYSDARYEHGENVNLRNVEISYNYVSDFMEICRDGGAYYTAGGNAALSCDKRFNVMHHNFATLNKENSKDINCRGFYLDGSASNWLLEDNVIDNCSLPLFSQFSIPCQYTHHCTTRNFYSTTPVPGVEGNHRPYHDVILENCVEVAGLNDLLAKYPKAKEIVDGAGYQGTL